MANHSFINLRRAVTPEDVERAMAKINERRFGGRLVLSSTEELTRAWQAAKAWILEAPGTRPKEPGPCNPDENLCYCFWLTKNRMGIETRHGQFNSWIRWVMYIHEHELARHFDIGHFDGGDGQVNTDPEQFKKSLFDWATRKLKKPLSDEDAAFIKKRFTDFIPEGWG